jgi:hypothetical protein
MDESPDDNSCKYYNADDLVLAIPCFLLEVNLAVTMCNTWLIFAIVNKVLIRLKIFKKHFFVLHYETVVFRFLFSRFCQKRL